MEWTRTESGYVVQESAKTDEWNFLISFITLFPFITLHISSTDGTQLSIATIDGGSVQECVDRAKEISQGIVDGTYNPNDLTK